MSADPVRVAICSDSRSYAAGLRCFLETDRRLQVVATPTSGEQLVGDLDRVLPGLITIDLELPGIGGAEAVRQVMATTPVPIVVISARTALDRDGQVSAALAHGALEVLAKCEVRLDRRLTPRAVALRRRLWELARRQNGVVGTRAACAPRLPRRSVATVVGIGASAGGPSALVEVLGGLPPDFDLPVLVVQHIAEGFTDGLATWLDSAIDIPVRLAQDGEAMGTGVVIAPDDAHLLLDAGGHLRLDRTTDCGSHRPSADVLLTSMAAAAGRGAVALVLTGMGHDGAAGVAAVRSAGGVALVEHSETAPLNGMPLAAEEAGATPLTRFELAGALAGLSGSAAR